MKVQNVIPIGTTVKVKDSDVEGRICEISISSTETSYNLAMYDAIYGKRTFWIKEDEVSGKYEKMSLLQSLIKVDEVKEPVKKTDLTNTTTHLLNSVIHIMINGYFIGVNNADMPTFKSSDTLPVLIVNKTYSYMHTEGGISLPNDTTFTLYNLNGDLSPMVDAMVFRIVRLKPFYRRMFNTLLYGRAYHSNFSYIESDEEYLERLTNKLTELCPNGLMSNVANVRI